MSDNIITVENLHKKFGSLHVLKGVTEHIARGEVVSVIGPSGGGKSTFLRCLNLLETPEEGRILFEGTEITDKHVDINIHRQKMGMVFQYSALFDFLTVGENVAFGLRQHTDKSESEIQGIVDEMLELVGLPQSKEQYPAELSGGMKKRVGLARAIANRPEIVLYDEPTAGLDPIMSNNISRLIRKTQQQLQVTSVLVTHDMESAFYAADRIAMLYKGKIVALGTVEEIRNGHNQIVDAFVRGKEIREEAVQ